MSREQELREEVKKALRPLDLSDIFNLTDEEREKKKEDAIMKLLSHHTATVLKEVEKEVIRPDDNLVACDQLHPDAYEVQPIIKNQQRKALSALRRKYGVQR